MQNLSREDMAAQARIMLGKATGGGAPLSLAGTVNTVVGQHSVVTTDLRGGTSTLDPSTHYSAWVDSIAASPALVRFSLSPLYELVTNLNLRTALANATAAYIAAAQSVTQQVGCMTQGAWNFNAEATVACSGCCVDGPVLVQNVVTKTVPAWTCPRYLEVVVNVDGTREDGIGEYWISGTVSAPNACGTSVVGGGSSSPVVQNPSFVGFTANKEGGSGYGWWYGGTTSRTFYTSDVSLTLTYTISQSNQGYPGAGASMTLVCH